MTGRHLDRLRREADDFEQQGLFEPARRSWCEITFMPPLAWPRRSPKQISSKKRYLNGPKSRASAAQHREAARPDAVIGSNTSTLPIGDLAAGLKHPERFLGVHFSNPAPFIPGVELIAHSGTDEQVVEAVEALVPVTGKLTARVNDKAGFVLNRLQYVLLREAVNLVEEGVATPEDVIVRTTFGYRLPFFGPLRSPTWPASTSTEMAFARSKRTTASAWPCRPCSPSWSRAAGTEVKQGGGFVTPAGDQAPLVAYRNTAYARLGQLLQELGPAPLGSPLNDSQLIEERATDDNCPLHRRDLADRRRHAAVWGKDSRGGPIHDAEPEEWAKHLRLVRRIGFTEVDPTDTWVRVADLSPERLADFKAC